jgi:DNA invertase Pin-like site-specific DNA recombinase
VSGGALLAKRPGLKAVIERMRCGQSDGVVVRAYERFMRSIRTVVGGDRADRGPRRLRHIGRLFAAQGNVDFQTPTGRMLSTQV